MQRSVEVHQVGEDEEGSGVGTSNRRTFRTAAAVKRAAVAEEASSAFGIAMFDHELKDREFESGTISAAAVSGLEGSRKEDIGRR